MAVQQHNDIYAALTGHVQRWDRRERVGQSLIWLPRTLVIALIAAIALALFSRTRPLFTAAQLTAIAAVLSVVSVMIAVALVWLRNRDLKRMALHYDVLLRGDERVSTALELIGGQLRSDADLMARQLADAEAWAASADAKTAIPLRVRGSEWGILVLAAAVFAVLMIVPNPQEIALAENAAAEAAIDAAAETVRDLTEDVAADPDLTEPERQQLLQMLQGAQDTLRRDNISPEEAFAALSEVEGTLGARAQAQAAESAAMRDAMSRAAGRLADAMESQPGSGDFTDLQEQLEQLSEAMDSMTEEQRAAMEDALRQAMEELQQTNPALADQLGAMADSMQSGAPSGAAQQAMQQAMQSAQQSAQQGQRLEQSAQRMDQRAQQAGETAEQMAEQQSDQPQDGSPGQPQEGSGQPNQAPQQGDGQPMPNGQPNPDQAGDQAGGEQPNEGETADSADPQPGSGSAGEFSPGQITGSAEQPRDASGADSNSSSASSGAGDQAADAGDQAAAFEAQGSVDSGNDPDGGGVGDYDAVYAPDRIGGESDANNQFALEPEGSLPSVEGEFAQNPSGTSNVPYSQVFSQYSAAADQAMNQGRVPLALADLVRSYFSSLEPDAAQP